LVGGPADGKVLDIPADRTHINVMVITDERQTWVEISQHPKGGVTGAGVTAGNYARTDWLHYGHVVYRYRDSRMARRRLAGAPLRRLHGACPVRARVLVESGCPNFIQEDSHVSEGLRGGVGTTKFEKPVE
jgi:hypothetical protein